MGHSQFCFLSSRWRSFDLKSHAIVSTKARRVGIIDPIGKRGLSPATDPSDRDVLKILRLITRPIQAVATPHLFHTLQVWTNLGSLQRLDMVSKTESLAVCIRKLDFFLHLYSPSFDITSGMLLIHSATGDIWEDWKSAFAPSESAALSSLAAKLSTEW